MTITTNSAKTVVVDRGYHWRPIDRHTPRSQKLQLIHERDGVAMYGTIGAARDAWTHWAPLPSFAPAHRADVDEWAGLEYGQELHPLQAQLQEVNALFKREYREPFAIPEQV